MLIKDNELSWKAMFYAMAGIILIWIPVLFLHLTIALFALMTIYSLGRGIRRFLLKLGMKKLHDTTALLVIILLSAIIIYAFGDWLGHRATDGGNAVSHLLQQMSTILEQIHTKLPSYIANYIPDSIQELHDVLIKWLKNNAAAIQLASTHTVRGLGYLIIGIALGGIMLIQLPKSQDQISKPLSIKFYQQFELLIGSFIEIFSAQIRISLLNTFLTSIYLVVILPLAGKPLPMTGTMVLITFIAGLLPVVGNLISNTIIAIVSFSDSLLVVFMSLTWLILIHKLEYFLNAHIIGHKIRAKAWELLICMLLFEAIFGIAGLISAPVIYAQIKKTLQDKKWID